MKFKRLTAVLPCHSLEDLTLQRPSVEAHQVLSAWTALWHPALLANAECVPSWAAEIAPPDDPTGCLLVVPGCCESTVPAEWFAKAAGADCCLIRQVDDRTEIIGQALARLDAVPAVDADLTADFLALGYAYCVVELLTRQSRYMSNLDETALETRALTAARSAVEGDVESARTHLRTAFEVLHEAREYFYPVDIHLLDLTLAAPGQLGLPLREEFQRKIPTNLLISGELLDEMAHSEPATLKALADAMASPAANVLGGAQCESLLPLSPPESVRFELKRGLATYQRHLGSRPTVFGRRRFGLSPIVPQVLQSAGFSGVLHFTLDDGHFPTGHQSRIRWEGFDRTAIEAIAKVPVDAQDASLFLRLPEKLSEAMDIDHAGALVFAHWPGGAASPWYEDLQRAASYSPALGTFVSVGVYLRDTSTSGQICQYTVDQYRSPYLHQAVAQGQADSISRFVRYYQRRSRFEAYQALSTLATLLSETVPKDGGDDNLLAEIEQTLSADTPENPSLDQRLQGRLDGAAFLLSENLARQDETAAPGQLSLNPCSFSRQQTVPCGPPEGPISQQQVEVPGMGFAWTASQSAPDAAAEPQHGGWFARKPKAVAPLAADNRLCNEHLQVVLDPITGAIQTMHDFGVRGLHIGQQIALRSPESTPPDEPQIESASLPSAPYSIMAADEISVLSPGPDVGEIRCRGRLVSRQGQTVARFVQHTRLARDSRVVEMDVELDIQQLPEPDPWRSYYGLRFAWNDANAKLGRGVNMLLRPTEATRLESPHAIDLRSGKSRITLLTGGLPYHRRIGNRMIDTLLVVHGETARRFRVGVGFGLPYAVPAAVDFLAPAVGVAGQWSPSSPSGWLFHLDARNVVATAWEPLFTADRVEGFRVRLLETEGRRANLSLRAYRAVGSARKTNDAGATLAELAVEDDRVQVPIDPHQWVQVECRWR